MVGGSSLVNLARTENLQGKKSELFGMSAEKNLSEYEVRIMENLRNEAIELVTTIPEKYLPSVIGLMKSFENISEEQPKPKKKIDFSKYMNKGERIFKSTEEIDEYIKESRRERKF